MSLVAWYQYKADQCVRMAKAVADPIKRADLLKVRKHWLLLASGMEPHVRNEFKAIDRGRTKGPIRKNLH